MINHAVRVTDASIEPLTLAEAKAWLRVDHDDENDLITSLITRVREQVENYTGLALLPQVWQLTASEWPSTDLFYPSSIELPRAPLISVDSVMYYPASGAGQTSYASSNYYVVTTMRPGFLTLKETSSFPDLAVRPDAVQIQYTVGHSGVASVPRALIHALSLLLTGAYERRDYINVGNIVNELGNLKPLLNAHRVDGWVPPSP